MKSIKNRNKENWKKLKQDKRLEKFIIKIEKEILRNKKILKDSNKKKLGKIFWQLVGRHVVALWPVA